MYDLQVAPEKSFENGVNTALNGTGNHTTRNYSNYTHSTEKSPYNGMVQPETNMLPQLHFPFMRDINKNDLQKFCARLVYKKYQKKEFVYLPYEADERVYFIIRGNVEIGYLDESGRELSLDILGSGDIFGAFMRGRLSSEAMSGSFARAVDKALIAFLNRDDFNNFLEKYPRFSTKIRSTMGQRIKMLENKLQNLVFSDVKTRICKLLYALYEKAGDKRSGQIKIQLTHQDIANLVASSRETASLHLSELKKNGVITYERKRIRILSLNSLMRYSCC